MRTRWRSVIALVSVLSFCVVPVATQEPAPLGLRIVSVENSGLLSVELKNATARSVRIWKDANSWGAARWRVMILRNGQLDGFFQNPNRAFTRNGPGFIEIESGSRVEKKVDLNDGHWCEIGECSSPDQREVQISRVSFKPGDVLIVIYDVPLTGEAQEMNVWYGVIASSTTAR
jgi:hypothetical protein